MTDRFAFIERDRDGNLVNVLVSARSGVDAALRRSNPDNVTEVRPARPGETTMSLAVELADAETGPDVVRRTIATIPVRIGR